MISNGWYFNNKNKNLYFFVNHKYKTKSKVFYPKYIKNKIKTNSTPLRTFKMGIVTTNINLVFNTFIIIIPLKKKIF